MMRSGFKPPGIKTNQSVQAGGVSTSCDYYLKTSTMLTLIVTTLPPISQHAHTGGTELSPKDMVSGAGNLNSMLVHCLDTKVHIR